MRIRYIDYKNLQNSTYDDLEKTIISHCKNGKVIEKTEGEIRFETLLAEEDGVKDAWFRDGDIIQKKYTNHGIVVGVITFEIILDGASSKTTEADI